MGKQAKRGRPATGRDPSITIRLPADLLTWIDQEAKARETGRSDMIRRLIAESRLGVPEELSRVRTAFHEAGHAVVARALGLPIEHVTIVPRQRAATSVSLGHLKHAESWWDTHKRLNPTGPATALVSAIYSHIMVCLAGREAEQMVLGFHHATGGDRQDRRDVRRLLKWAAAPEHHAALLGGLQSATMWAVMKDLPQSIKRVARAVTTSETLTQDQVDRLIAVTGERLSPQPWAQYLELDGADSLGEG